jgi:hypothetical protein
MQYSSWFLKNDLTGGEKEMVPASWKSMFKAEKQQGQVV